MAKQNVYMVQLDYSTADDDYVDTFLFKTYEDAKKKFEELYDSTSYINWIMNAIDAETIEEPYDIDSNLSSAENDKYKIDLWFNFKLIADYNYHFFLELRKMEIQ